MHCLYIPSHDDVETFFRDFWRQDKCHVSFLKQGHMQRKNIWNFLCSSNSEVTLVQWFSDVFLSPCRIIFSNESDATWGPEVHMSLCCLGTFAFRLETTIIVLFLFFSVSTNLFYRICKLSANLLIYSKILCSNMHLVICCYFSSREHATHGQGGIPVLLKARGLWRRPLTVITVGIRSSREITRKNSF